jgi:glycosyltransferase involved in cell wall biosynthesis
MAEICKGRFDFSVYTSHIENLEYLKKLGLVAKKYKFGLIDRFIAIASTSVIFRRIQEKLKLNGRFEKDLLKDGVDLVYFTAPSLRALSLQRLNYVSTVWDLSHLETPEFPEVRSYNQFLVREHQFQNVLPQSCLVISDSEVLKNKIIRKYGLDADRVISVPFSPSPFINSTANLQEVLRKYNLNKPYFFYPAQFWPHKNHIRLIEAIEILKKEKFACQLVFCGSDKGSLNKVKKVIYELGVEDRVSILGFVPPEDLGALYLGSIAVLMPSYFGPANLPPLEAWSLGVPLIQSSLHKEQCRDAAIFANPDIVEEWSSAIKKVLDDNVRAELISSGRKRLAEISLERKTAEIYLLNAIEKFSKRLFHFE